MSRVRMTNRISFIKNLDNIATELEQAGNPVLALAVDGDSFLGTFDAAGAAELLRAKYSTLAPEPALLERVQGLLQKSPVEFSLVTLS